MDTRTKLKEAKYFLDILPNIIEDSEKFYYNLSAFLTAWRSTLDVMLYDFAKKFSFFFTHEDEMTIRDFEVAAKTLNNTDAIRFISWWKQKQGILSNTPLWKKRNINLHRGSVPLVLYYTIYASGSGGTSGTISPYLESIRPSSISTLGSLVPQAIPPSTEILTSEWVFDDLQNENAIDVCKKAYDEMKKIVEEAETEFHIHL